MYVLFYVYVGTGFWIDLEKSLGYIWQCEKSFEMCINLLMTEFGHAEVTWCSWQDVKIQLLTS